MATTECLSAEIYSKIDEIVKTKGAAPSSLIEVLHAVQQEIGYLPVPVQQYVADALGLPPGTVESVVSFYSFFTTQPRGRHTVKVCQGTACYVRGGKRVLEVVQKQCGCGVGETSADQRFSVEVVRCIGACGLAPVMTVDEDIYDRVKTTRVTEILEKYE